MSVRIGIIGHFADQGNFCDGQTVKTRNLHSLLAKNVDSEIVKVDTYLNKLGGIRNKLTLLFRTLYGLVSCDHIFLLVADKGMRFYLPFLYYVNKVTRRKIYHYVIGSELLELVDDNPKLVKYLNALMVNWFEYESGTRYLQSKGVRNAVTLANFKLITPAVEAGAYEDELYRFCTFSRVTEEKGITEAIEAIRDINAECGRQAAMLDIYGPVDVRYEEKFSVLLKENCSCVRYMGIADSNGSVDILKDYYALLFPTHWTGEGVPGTIIDAFASGIPVIASDWRANRELITDGSQGIIYPNAACADLKSAIRWGIDHPQALAQMRVNSRLAFEKYTPDAILTVILEAMQL